MVSSCRRVRNDSAALPIRKVVMLDSLALNSTEDVLGLRSVVRAIRMRGVLTMHTSSCDMVGGAGTRIRCTSASCSLVSARLSRHILPYMPVSPPMMGMSAARPCLHRAWPCFYRSLGHVRPLRIESGNTKVGFNSILRADVRISVGFAVASVISGDEQLAMMLDWIRAELQSSDRTALCTSSSYLAGPTTLQDEPDCNWHVTNLG